MISDACISVDGRYRTLLTRRWDDEGSTLVLAMLNPSTADHRINDPTIRRGISFGQALGHGGLAVINIFSLRATDPSVLANSDVDIFGPDNNRTIRTVIGSMTEKDRLVAAWGAHPLARQYSKIITHPAFEMEVPIYCLGTTKDGSPRHPLYVHGGTMPTLWVPYREAA